MSRWSVEATAYLLLYKANAYPDNLIVHLLNTFHARNGERRTLDSIRAKIHHTMATFEARNFGECLISFINKEQIELPRLSDAEIRIIVACLRYLGTS